MSDRHGHDELDRLLQGEGPAERAALAAFLQDAREDLPEPPRADVAERQLAAITAAAAEAAHRVPTAADGPAGRPWAARARRLAGLTAVKVAIGVGAAAAATGTGLATTGNLPDPVQQVVADVADRIGIELPAPDTTPPAMLPDEAPSTVPPREAPGPDDDAREPTPARPGGGAPPAEVPGEGDPPADPRERASGRDEAGRDEVDPPSRRPEGSGTEAADRAPDVAQERDGAPAGIPADDASDEDAEEGRPDPDEDGAAGDDDGEAGLRGRTVSPVGAGAVPARANR